MTEILYPDIPRIYTAIAEWSMCLVYILFLSKRYYRRKTTVLCGAFLLVQILLLVLTGNVPLQYWILCMIWGLSSFLCKFQKNILGRESSPFLYCKTFED